MRVGSYDGSRFVLYNGDGKYYLINKKTKVLVDSLINSSNWDEAYKLFLTGFGDELTLDEFKEFIYSVLHIDNNSESKTRKSYLRLRLTLLNEKIAGSLGGLLTFLFKKKFFLYVFVLLLITNVSFILSTTSDIAISKDGWAYLVIFSIYIFSIVLHEIGHISACRRFGAQHGGIGVGFYLVFPVFWADVTGLWMLPRKERVITNLAGIHTQLFMNMVVMAAAFITGQSFLIIAADFIAMTSIFQLWPFMRYDGYWILSDTLETPNLMKISTSKIKELLLEWFTKREKSTRSYKDWYLIIYAFSNAFLTILYILFVVTNHGEIVIHYPTVTWRLVTSLVNGHFVSSDLLVNYLIVTLFYYIVVKKLFDLLYKYIKSSKYQLFHLNSLKA